MLRLRGSSETAFVCHWGFALHRLALGAEAKYLKGVKQRCEPLGVVKLQCLLFQWAAVQCSTAAAIKAGEVVHIPFPGGVKGFAAGQVPAAHLPQLLQGPQVSINRGQPHGSPPGAN